MYYDYSFSNFTIYKNTLIFFPNHKQQQLMNIFCLSRSLNRGMIFLFLFAKNICTKRKQTKRKKNEQSNRRRKKKTDDKENEKHYISFAANNSNKHNESSCLFKRINRIQSSFYTCEYFSHYIQIYVNKRTTLNNSK